MVSSEAPNDRRPLRTAATREDEARWGCCVGCPIEAVAELLLPEKEGLGSRRTTEEDPGTTADPPTWERQE